MSSSRNAAARAEPDLVQAARRGDDRAFEELYASYRQRIFAFILSKVRDHGRAEDIAQEVFISALRRLRASDQPIAFKPWIYEIAKNACIDEFRRGSRSREVPLESDEDLGAAQRPMISLVPTPPGAVENKQRLDDLRGAFGGLSESHHQLLVMREFEGLSYDEIGDRLGMTRQMVESSLFRARRKLTSEYDDLASGRRCAQIQTAIESGDAQSIGSLGVRERRRFARHLAHCQTCRHTARLAGVDEALLKPRSIAAKIAALLPFGLWRWPWGRGGSKGGATGAAARSGRHPAAAVRGAARVAQPAGSSLSIGQAAAAAAALVIAGAGAGLVTGLGNRNPSHPFSAVLAAESIQAGRGQATGTPSRPLTAAAADARAKQASIVAAASLGIDRLGRSRSGTPGPRPPRRRSGTSHKASTDAGPRFRGSDASNPADSAVSSTTGTLRTAISGVTGTVRSTASGVSTTVGATVSRVDKTVGSTLSGADHAVGGSAGQTAPGSSAGSAGSAVRSTVGKTVGALTGSGSSSSASGSPAAGAAGSVTAPAKSTVSGLLTK